VDSVYWCWKICFNTLIRAALEYRFVTVNSSDNTVSRLFLTFSKLLLCASGSANQCGFCLLVLEDLFQHFN
jgi:hypothetical protein